MKTAQPILTTSIAAAADLTAKANYLIGFDGAVCGANAKPLGVLQDNTVLGEMAPVVCAGIALVISGAAISVGAALVSTSAGKATPATTFSATPPSGQTPVTSTGAQPAMTLAGSVLPQVIFGYALDAASDANEYIRVLLV